MDRRTSITSRRKHNSVGSEMADLGHERKSRGARRRGEGGSLQSDAQRYDISYRQAPQEEYKRPPHLHEHAEHSAGSSERQDESSRVKIQDHVDRTWVCDSSARKEGDGKGLPMGKQGRKGEEHQ